MATHVIGGRHDGASFAPTNGVEARQRAEAQIVALRRQQRREEGRMRDEIERGFQMIARRRQKKYGIA